MSDDLMPFDLPTDSTSIIKVLGVGGGGSNAVNHMYLQGIKDVNFVICNTDQQALNSSQVPIKVPLGVSLTEGRGAGNMPDIGREAAIESLDEIVEVLSHQTRMLFITAGMGGGTGTGAAPVIAKAAKDLGILTVGIVTIPFRFEGQRRINQAIEGIKELKDHVDSLLVINNEKLREIFGDLTINEAFAHADDVLTVAAKGIAEIITVPGKVNVDFADVQTVMKSSGVALMGQAFASGEERAIRAIQEAISSPLLNNNDIHGAKNILLNITSGTEPITMDEIGQINEYVQEAAGYTADLIWGNTTDESFNESVSVTVIATGFETDVFPEFKINKQENKEPEKSNLKPQTNNDTDNPDPFGFIETEDENPETTVQQKEAKVQKISQNKFLLQTETDETETGETETDPFSDVKGIDDIEIESLFNTTENNVIEDKTSNTKSNDEQETSQPYYAENIDEYENTPAYKRKDKNPDYMKKKSYTNVDRYSLNDEDKDKHNRDSDSDNSYLFDNVD